MNDLLSTLEQWHQDSEYQKVIDRLEELSHTQKLDYALTCQLARAYNNIADLDKEEGRSQLERAEELGLEVYISQIEERRAILDQLLAGWNDGRRKSFYCLAVYLLELDDLRRAFEEIQAAAPGGNTVKEKVITAVGILKRTAESSGVALKLNKKPKER